MSPLADDASSPLQTLLIGFPVRERLVERLRARFPDITILVAPDLDGLTEHLPAANAIVAWGLRPDQLAAATRLKWIQTIGAGVEDIILPEMIERGIVLTNNSGVHVPNIAEHLMAMMLAFARRLPFLIRGQMLHEWRDQTGRSGTFELAGQTLVVVGLGDIGQALAVRAAAFGMNVIGVRRRRTDLTTSVSRVITFAELDQELGGADHVAICLPLTAETRGRFGVDTLAAMKRGSYLYNIGRGAIVDTQALIDALRRGQLGGAGLDVTDPEPLPAGSPLWDMENVIITCHTSGASPNYWDRAITVLETNIERYRTGTELLNVVDYASGY